MGVYVRKTWFISLSILLIEKNVSAFQLYSRPIIRPSLVLSSDALNSCPEDYEILESPGKGRGVFTRYSIPQHFVVGDYEGEILTEEEKDRRYLKGRRGDKTDEDNEWVRSREERGQTITGR